jgi:predicted alpha/beta superfamily hydrolase
VLYVTDADYAFPVIRSITRRVRNGGKDLEDFILVGLSYAQGEDGSFSRNRDYTPTVAGDPNDAGKGFEHGGAEAYRRYIAKSVFPFVEGRFRTDPSRRAYMGHSYGGLLGAHILFTEPAMFSHYILGSPSLWYDHRHIFEVERRYATTHRDLPAKVFMYIGAYEAVRRGDPKFHQDNDMVGDTLAFEQRLRSRNYPRFTIKSEVIPQENHLTVFPSGLTRGLFAVAPGRGR